HRLAVTPAGHHLPAEVLDEVFRPELLAALLLDADQVAIGAKGVDAVALHRRRAAWPVAVAVLEVRPDGSRPQLRRRRLSQVEAEDRFGLAVGAHRVEPIADDGRPREADAGVLEGPQQFGPALGPGL